MNYKKFEETLKILIVILLIIFIFKIITGSNSFSKGKDDEEEPKKPKEPKEPGTVVISEISEVKTPPQPEKRCYVNIQGNCSPATDGRYASGTYTPGTWVLDSTDIDESACINRRTHLAGCGYTRSRFNGNEDGSCEIKLAGNCSPSIDGRYASGTYTPGTWVFDGYTNTAADCAQRKTHLAGCGSVETRFEHSE